MKALLDELKKTTVFFGREDDQGNVVIDPETGSPQFFATGILINARGVFHLVTAKHVVYGRNDSKFTGKINDEGVRIFFNLKSGKIGSRSLKETKDILKCEWISHQDINVDIAIIPFGLNTD